MSEQRARIDRAIAALGGAGVDALMVTNLVNVRYLTGYTGSNGIVVLSKDRAVFITDFRYADGVEPLRALLDVVILERDIAGMTVEALHEHAPGCISVGFEGALPYALADRLRGMTPPGVELVLADGVIEELRIVKSDIEIAASRHAADILEVVYTDIANGTLVGRTEADVAWQIERTIREAGFPALSFESIVAAGRNGARPHADPGPTVIARGDLVTVDIGARGESGYCSDCTRTFSAGGAPAPEAAADYQLVLDAQLAGLGSVRPGVIGGMCDATAREVIADAGCGELFGHGLGHGTGLDIHEAPTLRKGSEDILAPGMIVTVEPGIYRPGKWGIRIEDQVVVTESGHEILTGFTKDLVETTG
ncbi:MAG: Xaa-Pro peptidase family protein [Actinobacteria bacterium]|nr:Xaa-Pro peptidase family protein [Actinomycetota bacterium]